MNQGQVILLSFQPGLYEATINRFPFQQRSICSFLQNSCQVTLSPDAFFNLPLPIHLLSLMPNTCKLYCLLSVVTCTSFPVSYMVRTFQKPILVFVFALITSNFMPVVSFWLSPLVVIRFEDLERSAYRILVHCRHQSSTSCC